MSALDDLVGDGEWIIHAATQDLTCLREVGIAPRLVFDTELAARLLGFPRAGLGPVVEEVLGIHLAKEHSAADWSTRPLPESWLEYAALDVELLVDLRDALKERLDEAGKAEIARQEFDAELHKDLTPAAHRPMAPTQRPSHGPRRTESRRRARAVERPRRVRARDRHRAGAARPGPLPRRRGPCAPDVEAGALRHQGVQRPREPHPARPLVGGDRTRHHDRGPPTGPRARGLAPAAACVGRPEPGGRCAP